MEFKELRKKAGLTQEQLADKLDIGQSTVASWECGKAKPRANTLIKLSGILNCTTDELLGKTVVENQ